MGIGLTLVDLAEDDYSGEAGFRVAWNGWVEDIDTCMVLVLIVIVMVGFIRMVPWPSAVVGTSW